MQKRVLVTWIKKGKGFDPHERILSLGGPDWKGRKWELPQSEVITLIESGAKMFYMSAGGLTEDLVIAKTRSGHKYLKSIDDTMQPEILLTLPEFPSNTPPGGG
jgi:hypothetical protein